MKNDKRFPGMKKLKKRKKLIDISSKRKLVNWNAVYELYKPGMLTKADISRQYEHDHKNSAVWKKRVTPSMITRHAKENGWEQNLAAQVKERINEKLVRVDVPDSYQSDSEIVEKAAEAGKNIILRQRKIIKELYPVREKLLKRVLGAKKSYLTKMKDSKGKDTIESKQYSMTIKEKASTLRDLAAVTEKIVRLERQAYNLNDKDDGESLNDVIKKELSDRIKGIKANG